MFYWISGTLLATAALIALVGYSIFARFCAPGRKKGRIEGVLLVDGKPAPQGTIVACSLSREYSSTPHWLSFMMATKHDKVSQGVSFIMWSEYTRTEDEGKFIFERIPEGEVQLGRAFGGTFRKSWFFGWVNTTIESEIEDEHELSAVIRANETTHVILGTSGTKLRGCFVIPGDAKLELDELHPICAFISTKLEPPEIPDGIPPDERDTWWETYYASEEGLQWRKAPHRMYRIAVDGQGRFTAANVHPGRYELQVQLDRSSGGGPARPFGEYEGVIDVPAVDSDATASTLDIGNLQLLLHTRLSPGDPLPSPQVRNHKAMPLEISACKNKHLLLCLWWPLDDIYGGVPKTLKALNKRRVGRNNEPQVLVITMAGQWAAAQYLLKEKKPDWALKIVHEDDSLLLATTFGVRSSAFFLFAPDGKLVEGEIAPEMLKTRLRQLSVGAEMWLG